MVVLDCNDLPAFCTHMLPAILPQGRTQIQEARILLLENLSRGQEPAEDSDGVRAEAQHTHQGAGIG